MSLVSGSPFKAGSQPQRLAAVQVSPAIPPPVVAESVLNAAGYALPGLLNYGVARGSMFVAFGQNLGPANLVQASAFPLPTQLGGTSISVTVGVASNFATLAVTADGKICSGAHSVSSTEWAQLQSAGTLNVGFIQLMRMNVSANIPGLGSGAGLADTAWASLFRWNTYTGPADQGLDMLTGRGTSFGGCSVYTFRGTGSSLVPPRANFLNAGSVLNVNGPKGTGQLVRSGTGCYDVHKTLGASAPPGISDQPLPPPYLEPGTITVSSAAGNFEVGPINAALTVPASTAALTWTNLDAISTAGIDRSADLTFTWTGGDPASEYAVLAGAVILPGMTDKIQIAVAFVCTEKISAGQFTVPSAVLSALPASNADDATSGMVAAGRAPLLGDGLKFSSKGLDLGYITHTVFTGTVAVYR